MSFNVPFNVPCITCRINLKETLKALPEKRGFYYCTRCEACYQYMMGRDSFGEAVGYLDPVKPGKEQFLRAVDDGVPYEQDPYFETNSTMPQDCVSIPPPQPEHMDLPKFEEDLPNFEEEREIIKKSNTVKEFLKNSLYLEKPYDK